MNSKQARRAYVSPTRAQAAADTRARAMKAASEILRANGDIGFSLEAVAAAAGVTRQTLYRSFGSQRGLLEAVLDDLSDRGGIGRLDTLADPKDPHAALDELVTIYCEFWDSDTALFHLYNALFTDPRVVEALKDRIAPGPRIIRSIVDNARPDAPPAQRKDMAELIFGLMQPPLFRGLMQDRSAADIAALLRPLVHDVVSKRA